VARIMAEGARDLKRGKGGVGPCEGKGVEAKRGRRAAGGVEWQRGGANGIAMIERTSRLDPEPAEIAEPARPRVKQPGLKALLERWIEEYRDRGDPDLNKDLQELEATLSRRRMP
jgi:hypothetical protein